jgi:hypothetical protein
MGRYKPYAEEHQQSIIDYKRQQRNFVSAVVDACVRGDHAGFYHLTRPSDDLDPGFWELTMRMIVRDVPNVSPDIQKAFQQVWIETKTLAMHVNNITLCQALRILLPPYTGEAQRLYRGASTRERQRRTYGVPWTSSLAAATSFAERYRGYSGGSVILETIAPAEAIISIVTYPPPLTKAKKAETGLALDTHATEYHDEAEFLVDRCRLGRVTMLRRFAQMSHEQRHDAAPAK